MILTYAEGMVRHEAKDYELFTRDLALYENMNTLLIPQEYIDSEFYHRYYLIHELFEHMVKLKYYSSISNIKRAVKNGTLTAQLSIIFATDISRSERKYIDYYDKITNLKDLDKYCSGVQYTYDYRTKEFQRHELYGNIIHGKYIERPLSYYDKK